MLLYTCNTKIQSKSFATQEAVARKYGWEDVYSGRPAGEAWFAKGCKTSVQQTSQLLHRLSAFAYAVVQGQGKKVLGCCVQYITKHNKEDMGVDITVMCYIGLVLVPM